MLTKVTIEPQRVLRAGIEFRFTGQEEDTNGDPVSEFVDIVLVVPPLNLDSFQAMDSQLKTLTVDPNIESMRVMVTALEKAIRRNYRGVPRWLIEQTLDVANMTDLTVAFMDVNGLKRKEIEAGKAAAAAATPTGTQSTAT